VTTQPLHGTFESLVARPDTHVVFDLQPESSTLLILFGGIAGGVSIPVFEFFKQTAGLPVKKAFFRDPRRGWYQLGIPGVGDTILDIRAFLDDLVKRSGARRLVMAGASAGGYAALLFGAWCHADVVLAFSPQTFIDVENRQNVGDSRWQPQIDALHASLRNRPAVLDLDDLLPPGDSRTCFQVHVSTDDPLDLLHARRIADRGGVQITEHLQGGHRLVKTLRDRGQLGPLLAQAISSEL
jgi:hypothetical protein